jgi:hypothetical protein
LKYVTWSVNIIFTSLTFGRSCCPLSISFWHLPYNVWFNCWSTKLLLTLLTLIASIITEIDCIRKIMSWKKKEFEDFEDLVVSFRLYFIIAGDRLYISTMYYLFL